MKGGCNEGDLANFIDYKWGIINKLLRGNRL